MEGIMERVLEKLPEHEWLIFVGLQQKLYFSSYSSSLLYIITAEIGTGGGDTVRSPQLSFKPKKESFINKTKQWKLYLMPHYNIGLILAIS